MKYLVPHRTDATFEDGTYIKALDFCKNNCFNGRCNEFYHRINASDYDKFITCPYGMSVYVTGIDGQPYFFICMRCRSAYEKSKAKGIDNPDGKVVYNPILDQENLNALIEYSIQTENENKLLTEKRASVESISHEVKKLNAQIKDRSDAIIQTFDIDTFETHHSQELKALIEKIKTIYICSAMVNTRFSLLDYEKNPQVLQQGAIFSCNIYKKFSKMIKIFSNYLGRKVPIEIRGNSYRCIDAYPTFEMIPLLIIDNAVKYSYQNSPVTISFSESESNLLVDIESYSPYCSKEDLDKIFTKGYRGKHAARVSDGSGIGLFFAKMLCDLHKVEISVSSDNNKITNINDIPYAPFNVSLTFSNTYLNNAV
jgi:hypothetical protein